MKNEIKSQNAFEYYRAMFNMLDDNGRKAIFTNGLVSFIDKELLSAYEITGGNNTWQGVYFIYDAVPYLEDKFLNISVSFYFKYPQRVKRNFIYLKDTIDDLFTKTVSSKIKIKIFGHSSKWEKFYAKKLGFKCAGVLKQETIVDGNVVDVEIWELLKDDIQC